MLNAAQPGVAADQQQLGSIDLGSGLAAYFGGRVGSGQRCCWPLNASPLGSVRNAIFYLGLGLLFTHELDSMPNHEWRILPFVSSLSNSTGELIFVVAHVPLFAIVIALVASLNRKVRSRARAVASGFLVLHALLHFLFSARDAYEFTSLLSSALIYGAAVCGAACLLATTLERNADAA